MSSKLTKEPYSNINRLKLLNATTSNPKFVLEKSPFNEDDDEGEAAASSSSKEHVIIGRIFPDSEVFREGSFQIEIKLTPTYPFDPPEVRLLTPIYHPNVGQDEIGREYMDNRPEFNRKALEFVKKHALPRS
ncbi:unnamed protein product [Rotaria sp. Silwood2]|nr:unnamed protein product [Rotaria sp. Silwood2]CAF2914466.1 unnamed protein product [Rotaria sp. Silwood2]CAF3181516.1 unnamed protein product [Rotaria sp. Silwood2]CAF3322105.1 unnamed protein product [Rotaria sp. Silwood2]CAF4112438.1 unnamed protein product [Rotaria sp. Silwood2]